MPGVYPLEFRIRVGRLSNSSVGGIEGEMRCGWLGQLALRANCWAVFMRRVYGGPGSGWLATKGASAALLLDGQEAAGGSGVSLRLAALLLDAERAGVLVLPMIRCMPWYVPIGVSAPLRAPAEGLGAAQDHGCLPSAARCAGFEARRGPPGRPGGGGGGGGGAARGGGVRSAARSSGASRRALRRGGSTGRGRGCLGARSGVSRIGRRRRAGGATGGWSRISTGTHAEWPQDGQGDVPPARVRVVHRAEHSRHVSTARGRSTPLGT
jgi:hypothetical protein